MCDCTNESKVGNKEIKRGRVMILKQLNMNLLMISIKYDLIMISVVSPVFKVFFGNS
jgi:hypothetical protein